jgi:hypothetical protein
MFNLNAEDRLRSWRDFRSSLNSLPLNQALARTAGLWASAPFVPYYLDPEDVQAWPNPWDLIDKNYYCDIAKCLGIIYTISLTAHKSDIEPEFRSYTNPKTQHVYNLAWFNQGKYILNLIDGEIVNKEQFDQALILNQTVTAAELQLENL